MTSAPVRDVTEWARPLIRQGKGDLDRLPAYGSPEWWALPVTTRWAAVLVAAECWRQESQGDAIVQRLEVELFIERWKGPKYDQDAAYAAQVREHRATYRRGLPEALSEDRGDLGQHAHLLDYAEIRLLVAADVGDEGAATLWGWVRDELEADQRRGRKPAAPALTAGSHR